MSTKYASGKFSIAECDICGQRYKLKELRKLTIKTKQVSIKACPECWNPDHPQLQLGMYPVYDPQAVREPRPDVSYYQSGLLDDGYAGGGSRVFQWGWNPVGGSSSFDAALTPNNLALQVQIGTVTIVTT
jgi:hypothetical protein